MSRPMVLVFLLVILIITSQFEWKQQLANELEASSAGASQKQQRIVREEAIKERIILSQEKNIQRLNELVQTLQQQLMQCRTSVNTSNGTRIPLATSVDEIEQQQVLQN